MAEKNLAGMRVAILATQNFEQSELTDPRQALEEAGATTRVIAPKSGEIQGVKHDEKGEKIAVDLTLDKADPEDFDAVLLPGAAWEDKEVIRDRNWVSSRQPGDIPAFNREMLELFAESYARSRKAA